MQQQVENGREARAHLSSWVVQLISVNRFFWTVHLERRFRVDTLLFYVNFRKHDSNTIYLENFSVLVIEVTYLIVPY